MRDVSFVSNVSYVYDWTSRENAGNIGKEYPRLTASPGEGEGKGKGRRRGINQSRISRRTRCKFPCCNLVSHLIRPTTFCLYCVCLDWRKRLRVLFIGRDIVKFERQVRSRLKGKVQGTISTSSFPFAFAFSFPPSSRYVSYLERAKRDKINEIKGSEKAFYFPPFRLYRK